MEREEEERKLDIWEQTSKNKLLDIEKGS